MIILAFFVYGHFSKKMDIFWIFRHVHRKGRSFLILLRYHLFICDKPVTQESRFPRRPFLRSLSPQGCKKNFPARVKHFRLSEIKCLFFQKDQPNDLYRLNICAHYVCTLLSSYHAEFLPYKSSQSGQRGLYPQQVIVASVEGLDPLLLSLTPCPCLDVHKQDPT